MRWLLLRLFFHLRFWPLTLWRLLSLLVRGRKLQVHSVETDRAFYVAGSTVSLFWEVENAWLITVNHPGGFYHGSDSTWFTATPDMGPLRITIRGLGGKVRKEIPLKVVPYTKRPAADRYRQARVRNGRLLQGPQPRPKTRRLLDPKAQLGPNALLFDMGR
ncbi:MAG: hypothetical protein AAF570_18215, partial [Bacteroidota bacterium]